MFNRQPFNRGKFNTANLTATGSNGIGLMVMSTKPLLATRTLNASGIAEIRMNETTSGTIVKYNNGGCSLVLGNKGIGTKEFRLSSGLANMAMGSSAGQSLGGESLISLTNLGLKPNDTIIINTCDMTVTINGQNAMSSFGDESEFISLLNGLNTMIYNDNSTSRKISFDVIWKDRWL